MNYFTKLILINLFHDLIYACLAIHFKYIESITVLFIITRILIDLTFTFTKIILIKYLFLIYL
jgi:hypothetical protein